MTENNSYGFENVEVNWNQDTITKLIYCDLVSEVDKQLAAWVDGQMSSVQT